MHLFEMKRLLTPVCACSVHTYIENIQDVSACWWWYTLLWHTCTCICFHTLVNVDVL